MAESNTRGERETLRAAFDAAGDPPTTIEYQWRRCKADKPDDCGDIKAATYTVTQLI